jgi:L-2,4-diaminobutyric acid acetyltransferase
LINPIDRSHAAQAAVISDISDFHFRPLAPADGGALHMLVAACQPLDTNSLYCNLLQCSHFKATSIGAFAQSGDLFGIITGYRIPDRTETLFVWQVAVHPTARGRRLSNKMLHSLVDSLNAHAATHPDVSPIRYVETSITSGNEASIRLFTGFAKAYATLVSRSVLFDKVEHFAGAHDTEYLFRIGPLHGGSVSEITSTGGKS